MAKKKVSARQKRQSKHTFFKRHPVLAGLLMVVLLFVAGLILLLQTSGRQSDDSFVFVDDVAGIVQLPKDDAAHDVMTEWWYYNGHLTTPSGRKFSYHYTIFAHKTLVNHTIVHATLLDVQTMQTYMYESRIPGFNLAQLADQSLLIGSDQWNVAINNTQHQLNGRADNWAFSLQLADQNPVVYHDHNGLLDLQAAGESYYYTRPRMQTQGILTINGDEFAVNGTSWFDHQWGDFRAGVLAWDWFGLQLEDGIDIMLFSLRNDKGKIVYYGGTFTQNGKSWPLSGEDIEMIPLEYWQSPTTLQSYPVSWAITIAKHDIAIETHSVKQASEFDARNSSYILYWEGPVQVSGSHTGVGFLEVKKANASIASPHTPN